MYKFETIEVSGGLFKAAFDKATVTVQARLDEGYRMGWKLINCQSVPASVTNNSGLVFFLVWDTMK